MLIADKIDYAPLKVLNQKDTPMCSVYGFFGMLAEYVQQEYNLDVEFDLEKYFNEMESKRKGGRTKWLLRTAKYRGFRTTTGELVKIGSFVYIARHREKLIKRRLQATGPMIAIIRMYKGWSFDRHIVPPVKGKERKGSTHFIWLRGFNNEKQSFRIQNSWGKYPEGQWISYNNFKDMVVSTYAIDNVTIEK